MTTPPLFQGLCDDAALFPPGNAPLDIAIKQHLAYRESTFSDLVGPFVFPIPRLHELTAFSAPIEVALTAPNGPDTVIAGVAAAQAIQNVTVVAVEVAVPQGTDIGDLLGLPSSIQVYVEIPRDSRKDAVLDAVQDAGYRAKFRTGGVTRDAYPSEHELAMSIVDVATRKVPFKATAGLHHAIRNTDADTGFEQHGYLNIVLAAQLAEAGASVSDVEHVLALRDPQELSQKVAAISGPRAFCSFGTCSVREPLEDLITLGLLPTTIRRTSHGAA